MVKPMPAIEACVALFMAKLTDEGTLPRRMATMALETMTARPAATVVAATTITSK